LVEREGDEDHRRAKKEFTLKAMSVSRGGEASRMVKEWMSGVTHFLASFFKGGSVPTRAREVCVRRRFLMISSSLRETVVIFDCRHDSHKC